MVLARALRLSCVILVGAAACAPSDVGTPAPLLRSGGRPVTEGELAALLSEQAAFISLGNPSCESLTALRTSAPPPGTDLSETALGYCTRDCLRVGAACGDAAGFSCRQFLAPAPGFGPTWNLCAR